MKTKVKIGYIGLGRRGMYVLKKNIVYMDDIDIAYISDLSTSRMEEAAEVILENMGTKPKMTTDYRDILNDASIDAVFMMSGWDDRIAMAIEAMRA